MDQTSLLTAGQLARRLRVRVAWVKAEATAGRIPHVPAEPGPLFDFDAVAVTLRERAKRIPEGDGGRILTGGAR